MKTIWKITYIRKIYEKNIWKIYGKKYENYMKKYFRKIYEKLKKIYENIWKKHEKKITSNIHENFYF